MRMTSGLSDARCGNRVQSVAGFSDDLKLGPLLQQLAEHTAHRGVIIDHQNPERLRRRGANGIVKGRPGRDAAHTVCVDPALRLAPGRDQAEPCPLPGGALDVESAAQQRQAFADAEQTPSAPAGLPSFGEPRRIEPDPLVRYRDAERVILIE